MQLKFCSLRGRKVDFVAMEITQGSSRDNNCLIVANLTYQRGGSNMYQGEDRWINDDDE